MNTINNDDLTNWNHAGDYASQKTKTGKDKRLHNKAERKAQNEYRKARQNRHNY